MRLQRRSLLAVDRKSQSLHTPAYHIVSILKPESDRPFVRFDDLANEPSEKHHCVADFDAEFARGHGYLSESSLCQSYQKYYLVPTNVQNSVFCKLCWTQGSRDMLSMDNQRKGSVSTSWFPDTPRSTGRDKASG